MVERFEDRTEAGQRLSESLAGFKDRPDVLVLALPRGGVPVAFEVAQALRAPLDVFVVRKLGTPGNEELAMGAIASGGIRVLNESVVSALRIPADLIDEVAERELQELERRERVYRKDRPAFDLRGRAVILIDDGIATGSTMRAAIKALKPVAGRLVVAVPTVAYETAADLRPEVDELVALMTPTNFYAVGQWYEDFSQTTDSEVTDLLERANRRRSNRES
jgi:predicted phosphoribosyltransferase